MENNPLPQSGTLYLIATPIGDPLDLSVRALDLMTRVDFLAAEDTRLTRRLLASHNANRQILSYHEHNAITQKYVLLNHLQSGRDVALVSDAGTPLVSDPGWGLVQLAIAKQILVRPVPGPCALVAALISSGLPCHEFLFSGFVPRKISQRTRLWQSMLAREVTTIFYLPAHLVLKVLDELCQHLPERRLVLHKEITKAHERIWRDTPERIVGQIRRSPALSKGEFVMLVGGVSASTDD